MALPVTVAPPRFAFMLEVWCRTASAVIANIAFTSRSN
jgi:hypothetical protein